MGPPGASSANKRPLKFSRENHITPKHPQKDSQCAILAFGAIRDIRIPWIQTLKMTLSEPYHDSWSMLYGGVLTGGLLKETEEEGFTFVTQNVTHTIR